MITAKNLQKAGFVPGGKTTGGKFWWRDWKKVVRPGMMLLVTEDSEGSFLPEIELRKEIITLNLTTVTELITLAKLLK